MYKWGKNFVSCFGRSRNRMAQLETFDSLTLLDSHCTYTYHDWKTAVQTFQIINMTYMAFYSISVFNSSLIKCSDQSSKGPANTLMHQFLKRALLGSGCQIQLLYNRCQSIDLRCICLAHQLDRTSL